MGYILEKAHVQHPVGLVENDGVDLVQPQGVAVVVVHQATGRGNHDLWFFLQLPDLAFDLGTAVDHGDPDAGLEGEQRAQLVTDLDGQFPSGGQNQTLKCIRCRVDVFEHGDAKGKGFASPGRGFGDDIFPLQHGRNGLRLHLCGIAVTLFLQRFQNGVREAEIGKGEGFIHDVSSCLYMISSNIGIFLDSDSYYIKFQGCLQPTPVRVFLQVLLAEATQMVYSRA